jgi:hypothetical protein
MLTRVRSNGDGSFALPRTWDDCGSSRQIGLRWNAEYRSQQFHAADTNGDGLADFLVAFDATNRDDAAALHDDVSPSTGLDTHRWVATDVTGDGRRDLLHVRIEGNQNHVDTLLQQADGNLTPHSVHVAPPLSGIGRPVARDWKVMDVNGDGRTDLVYVHCNLGLSGICSNTEVEALVSTGGGGWVARFLQRFVWPGALPDTPQVLPMDVNGDGRTDLVLLLNTVRPGSTGNGLRVQTLLAQDDKTSAAGFTFSQPPYGGRFRMLAPIPRTGGRWMWTGTAEPTSSTSPGRAMDSES